MLTKHSATSYINSPADLSATEHDHDTPSKQQMKCTCSHRPPLRCHRSRDAHPTYTLAMPLLPARLKSAAQKQASRSRPGRPQPVAAWRTHTTPSQYSHHYVLFADSIHELLKLFCRPCYHGHARVALQQLCAYMRVVLCMSRAAELHAHCASQARENHKRPCCRALRIKTWIEDAWKPSTRRQHSSGQATMPPTLLSLQGA